MKKNLCANRIWEDAEEGNSGFVCIKTDKKCPFDGEGMLSPETCEGFVGSRNGDIYGRTQMASIIGREHYLRISEGRIQYVGNVKFPNDIYEGRCISDGADRVAVVTNDMDAEWILACVRACAGEGRLPNPRVSFSMPCCCGTCDCYHYEEENGVNGQSQDVYCDLLGEEYEPCGWMAIPGNCPKAAIAEKYKINPQKCRCEWAKKEVDKT